MSDEEDGGEHPRLPLLPLSLFSPLSAHGLPLPLGGTCQPPVWPQLALGTDLIIGISI